MKLIKCSVLLCKTLCNVNDEVTRPVCDKCFKNMIEGGPKK